MRWVERRRAPDTGTSSGIAAATDRLAIALGRGLVAGVAATAAMTVASTLEMRLRGRPPSSAPARVAGKVLGVRDPEQAAPRFAVIAHAAAGIALGTTRGLLDLTGLRNMPAAGAFFALAWAPDLVGVPAAGVAEPPWRWGATEVAISAAHHAVYAAAGDAVYRSLSA